LHEKSGGSAFFASIDFGFFLRQSNFFNPGVDARPDRGNGRDLKPSETSKIDGTMPQPQMVLPFERAERYIGRKTKVRSQSTNKQTINQSIKSREGTG
jgi:hypothetical protein